VVMARAVQGRPVKLRMTREEEFVGTNVRQSLVAHTKIGCDAEGNLLAMETRYYFGGGAYNDYGVNIARAGIASIPTSPSAAPCAALACPRSTGASSRSWTNWRPRSSWTRPSSGAATASRPAKRS